MFYLKHAVPSHSSSEYVLVQTIQISTSGFFMNSSSEYVYFDQHLLNKEVAWVVLVAEFVQQTFFPDHKN